MWEKVLAVYKFCMPIFKVLDMQNLCCFKELTVDRIQPIKLDISGFPCGNGLLLKLAINSNSHFIAQHRSRESGTYIKI